MHPLGGLCLAPRAEEQQRASRTSLLWGSEVSSDADAL